MPTRKSPDPEKKAPAAKKPAASHHDSQDDSLYTDPALRHRLKEEIQAGDKGGRPGQWSARKSQLLAKEYEAAGGAYTHKRPVGKQKDLRHWTEQDWKTVDGGKAVRGEETARYLPKEAWDQLTPAQRKATDAKKRAASKKGEQTVPNTAAAKKARKEAE